MNIIEFDQVCTSCNGTGLYQGMAERNGAAVVCHTCKGTGCKHVKFEYESFTSRKKAEGVKRVFRVNPGVMIGENEILSLEDFGGMPVGEWQDGKPFPTGSEDRKHTCPKWWYQCADYRKGPKWKECDEALGVTFSRCPYFATKDQCWKRFDDERNEF